MCLSLATTPMPTGGAPGAGRLQLLPAPPDQLRREDPAEEAAGAALSREKLGGRRWRSDFSSAGGEDDGSCEVNGRLYRDGETFQPHCRLRCRCEDGGFTCVPLCSEDVRLPSWDCPHPRRVEVPGKCCPEWVCDQGVGLGVQPLPAQGNRKESIGCIGDGAAVEAPLASPARNGALPGVPARPPAAWAWPPECPIRTASAAWRPSNACAYWGPAHPPGATAQEAEPFRARLRMETLCQPLGRQSGLQATVRLGSAIQALKDKRISKPAGPSGPRDATGSMP
ncbi:hypothetical protein E5288_WYG013121 [Bos mutus]|uniref:VWFC domain-containing protein n=1 Tax=Bos mutus TaxID=72004 RepID=A0A6B0R929_9CETA|nr:hypothetical protein [Bos mutus]